MEEKKIKVAIITANVGSIDETRGIPLQNMETDFFCFCDNNLPYPLPNLNNRLKSRYPKMQAHRFLPGYDLYIWIDGRVEILSKDFSKEFLELATGFDVAMFDHWERKNVYEEMEYIIGQIKKGSPYLVPRYANQQMEAELKFYADEKLPKDFPLYACTIFSRWNNPKLNAAFDEWWRRCIEFSYFDQTMFSYVAHKHDLKINTRDINKYWKHLTLHRHI
jgi:hypothetical protein